MKNKRWTPQTEITDCLLESRERRKWQITLRRYVLEKKKSPQYAPYFGIGIEKFREWIELQFEGDENWQNFGKTWKLEHIVPIGYFDFGNEDDLRLCWNFTNIQVSSIAQKMNSNKIDIIAAKAFFKSLYANNRLIHCNNMVKKIEDIELTQGKNCKRRSAFLDENTQEINEIATFSEYEFDLLNSDTPFDQILEERKLLAKFGT